MHDHLIDIFEKLYFDEELLRLLYYPPENLALDIPDPLSPTLPNILDLPIKDQWEIRKDRISKTPKSEDLTKNRICRLYIYAGNRRPQSGNYSAAAQDIKVDILCHYTFEEDLRSMRISDRVNKLLVNKPITGMGKMEYVNGNPAAAPNDYVKFQHLYRFAGTVS